jgi:hypothetical protein
MIQPRIGELLGQMGTLSPHDIDEILSEQRATRARFGTLAVSLGFCQPEHIWAAWSSQIHGHPPLVDLDQMGIDAQAIECVSRQLALDHHAMPVRLFEGQLFVAMSDPAKLHDLAVHIPMPVRCVLASDEQISRALDAHYAV